MVSAEYLGNPTKFLAMLEQPDCGNPATIGVVICYPTGHEHTHSYSTMVQLARQLNRLGIVSIRFDYPGTANASGNLSDLGDVNPWIESIVEATHCLKARTGVTHIALFGARLGGTLAALAAQRTQASLLALWNPVIDGRSLVRDLEMMSNPSEAFQADILNAGGFHYSRSLANSISQLRLSDADLSNVSKLTFLDRSDAPTGQSFCQSQQHAGIDARHILVDGYTNTFRQPQYSTVAQEMIQQVCGLVQEEIASLTTSPSSGSAVVEATSSHAARSHTLMLGEGIQETAVTVALPGAPTFAILTSPPREKLRKAIIWPNTGAAHQIGPGRLHVDISRELAKNGIAVLRMDLRNIGDGVEEPSADLNDPYPATAADDVAAAALWLKAELGLQQLAVMGVCSGAYAGFKAAEKLGPGVLSDLLMLNPEYFLSAPVRVMPSQHLDTSSGMSVEMGLWDRGLQHLRHPLSLIQTFVDPGWLPWRSRLFRAFAELKDSGIKVTIIFAQHDDRIKILQRLCGSEIQRMETLQIAKVRTLADADHLFSTQESRSELCRQVIQYLEIN